MKILNEGQADPNFLSTLDRKSNIIMCLSPTESDTVTESKDFPDSFGINLSRDCNISSSELVNVSLNIIATTIVPNLKISFPVGIKLQFNDFVSDHNQDIFLKNYKSFDIYSIHEEENKISHHIIDNLKFIMYIDTFRIRETKSQMVLKKGTQILDFYFTWYAQTRYPMPQIEEIYLIADQQIYDDFLNIF